MKIIHTADVHLDASFAGTRFPSGFGHRRRQGLREVFQSILQRAVEWPADAVLIAGDLFDLDRVTRDTVAFLRENIETIWPVPVFIAAGNHDPCMKGSPYLTEPWPANMHLFAQPQWTAYALDGVPLTVHGFGFDGPDISSNPFGALTIPDDGRMHAAVAHGSERGHQPPGKDSYAPFDADSAAVPGLKYLALGHFHSVTPVPNAAGVCMYYSGAPEGHDFNACGVHHYLEVELSDAGEVSVTPVPSSRAIYAVETLDCTPFTNSSQLVDALRDFRLQECFEHIVRVTLKGAMAPAIQSVLPSVREVLSEEFLFLDLLDETIPLDDYEELAQASTTLGAFVQRINQEIHDAPDAAVRAMLERARQAGVNAYRGREMPIAGLEGEAE